MNFYEKFRACAVFAFIQILDHVFCLESFSWVLFLELLGRGRHFSLSSNVCARICLFKVQWIYSICWSGSWVKKVYPFIWNLCTNWSIRLIIYKQHSGVIFQLLYMYSERKTYLEVCSTQPAIFIWVCTNRLFLFLIAPNRN